MNIYLSVLAGWAGIILAVCFLVYVCAKALELVARWRHMRRLDAIWRDAPIVRARDLVSPTQATPGVVSPKLFDRERQEV